ncbi:MAG: hypothetical protein V2I67_06780 [Thermoanaerobaculales bacterium]|jgi:hypothetical protein|nr:hypothetical protein [Thermoanaerobaculales bacterium]
MTTEILPRGSTAAHRAVGRLLTSLEEAGADLPPRVFVGCAEDQWQRHAVSLPTLERRRSVLVASAEDDLVDAVRLEIGGAAGIPASLHALGVACEAAARTSVEEAACIATRAVLEIVLDRGAGVWLVGWRPAAFWYRQIGSPRLIGVLQRIADRLHCIPAIVPGPFLVIAGCSGSQVEAACSVVDPLVSVMPAPVEIASLSASPDRTRVESLIEAVGRADEEGPAAEMNPVPVLELPNGRLVGRWARSEGELPRRDGWSAVPDPEVEDGSVWRLEDGDERRSIVESATTTGLERSREKILRVPGWIGAALQPGRPAALLVERLAGCDARRGRSLWVPSVDADGVRFLLGLPGPTWVDGPGVPAD